MHNGVKNIWRVDGLVNVKEMISVRKGGIVPPDRIHLKMGTLLASYLGEEFIMRPYNRGTAMGIADPETRYRFWIEVGNWYNNNWHRNRNGKHIGFYFWNHGGLKSFEREGGKIIKNIIRPEDKKGRRQNTFIIFERTDQILEEGALFDQGVELGSRALYMVPYIQKDATFKEGARIPLYLKEDPRKDLWDAANSILSKNGFREIYLFHQTNEYIRSKKEYDLLKYEDGIIQGESPRPKGLYRYTMMIHRE